MPEVLNDADISLLDRARSIIALRQRQEWHHIGCAIRTRSGAVFAAVHLEAYVGRVAVCAEAIAVGMAAAAGDTDISVIVAVNRAGEVVAHFDRGRCLIEREGQSGAGCSVSGCIDLFNQNALGAVARHGEA